MHVCKHLHLSYEKCHEIREVLLYECMHEIKLALKPTQKKLSWYFHNIGGLLIIVKMLSSYLKDSFCCLKHLSFKHVPPQNVFKYLCVIYIHVVNMEEKLYR